MRLCTATAVAVVAVLAAGCTASTGHPSASGAPLPPDPHTAAALLQIAATFNHDYDTGDYRPVYARWDARSQAIITRADYIQRHKRLPRWSAGAGPDRKRQPGRPARRMAGALRARRPAANRLLVLCQSPVGV